MTLSPRRALLASLGFLSFLPAARADEFDSNGVRLHFSTQGRGEPVVLIHGLMSSGAMNWELPGTARLLASRYQVILFDCRGHGKSESPAEDDRYGLEMVEDVTRLLDHLKISQAHLVGYSMGGMITLKFLVLHPDRVRSAVLGGMGWLRSGSPLEKFWERTPDKEEARPPSACLRGLSHLGVTEEEVRAVKIPVSIVAGDRDPCRKLYIEPLLRVRPDWKLTPIEDAGHFTCILKDAFKEAVKAGLDAEAGK